MKALVGAFNQEKALVGAFSVIVQPVVEPIDRFAALHATYVVKSLTIQDLLPHSLLCSDAILVHAWFEHKDSMGPEACEGVSVL